jgi:hypothetical protein
MNNGGKLQNVSGMMISGHGAAIEGTNQQKQPQSSGFTSAIHFGNGFQPCKLIVSFSSFLA